MGSGSDQTKRTGEQPDGVVSEDRVEAKIDRDLQDSFPASDPPGWVLGVKRPSGEKQAADDDTPPAAADDAGGG